MTNAERARAKRAEARRLRLCQTCPIGRRRAARAGKSTCEECSARAGKYQRRMHKRRVAQGLCVGCALLPPTIGKLCAGCDERRRGYHSHGKNVTRERRGAALLCRECGLNTAIRGTRCQGCADIECEKKKARVAERVAAGLFYRCGRGKAPAGKGCGRCIRKRRSKADRRKTPRPLAEQTCGACGETGHRSSSRKCRLWTSKRGRS